MTQPLSPLAKLTLLMLHSAQENLFNIETDRDVELINWETDRLLVRKATDGNDSDVSYAPSEPGQPARMRRASPVPRPPSHRMELLRQNADHRGAEIAKERRASDEGLLKKVADWKKRFTKSSKEDRLPGPQKATNKEEKPGSAAGAAERKSGSAARAARGTRGTQPPKR